MSEQVLCESVLSVRIDGSGDRTLVVVKNGAVARFWTDTSEMEGVLAGFPLQLSALEGSCLFQRVDNEVQAVFSVAGSGTRSCAFPATDLAQALERVRADEGREEFV